MPSYKLSKTSTEYYLSLLILASHNTALLTITTATTGTTTIASSATTSSQPLLLIPPLLSLHVESRTILFILGLSYVISLCNSSKTLFKSLLHLANLSFLIPIIIHLNTALLYSFSNSFKYAPLNIIQHVSPAIHDKIHLKENFRRISQISTLTSSQSHLTISCCLSHSPFY